MNKFTNFIYRKLYLIRDKFVQAYPSPKYIYFPCSTWANFQTVVFIAADLYDDSTITLESVRETEKALKNISNEISYDRDSDRVGVVPIKLIDNNIDIYTNEKLKIINERQSMTQKIKLNELKGSEVSPIVLDKVEILESKIRCYDIIIKFLSDIKDFDYMFYIKNYKMKEKKNENYK